MTTRQYCCFKGRGEISLADYLAMLALTAGLMPVGNAPQFAVNVTETTESIKDYVTVGGGTACHFREIDEVQLALTLACHTPDALVRSLYGDGVTEGVVSAAVVGESKALHIGAVAPLDHLIDESVDVVVKSPDDATTYVVGRDYTVTPAGSLKHVVGGTIPAPTVAADVGTPNVKVSYTRKVQTVLQLFTKPSNPVVLHFDGYNIAAEKPFAVQFDLFKVRLSAASTVQLIGDNLSKLEFTGVALRDETKPRGNIANPLSQYGTLKL